MIDEKNKELNKEFPCDVCGSEEAVEVPHAEEYTNGQKIHICKKCGFVYVKKRRSAEDIAKTWSEDLFGKNYTSAIPAVKARLTFVAEFINSNIGLKNKKVCDIGAGEGEFLNIIKQEKYGASVFGIEPSKDNCELMNKKGIENYNGTVEDYFKNVNESKKFDIVTISWTLENCQSCKEMLNVAYKILNEKGHIIIATGSRILVPFKKPLYLYLSKNHADTHSFRFSTNTLKALLALSNFKTVHLNRYIDNDVLCIIAQKTDGSEKIEWAGDNYLDVYNFFERWHTETKMYYSENK